MNPDEILVNLLKEEVITNSIETQLVLWENYDIFYKLHTHDVSKSPFSLMELHESERFDTVNPLYELYERYIKADVLKYTGITLDKFLEFPREQVIKLLEICTKKQREDFKSKKPLLDELDRLKG